MDNSQIICINLNNTFFFTFLIKINKIIIFIILNFKIFLRTFKAKLKVIRAVIIKLKLNIKDILTYLFSIIKIKILILYLTN